MVRWLRCDEAPSACVDRPRLVSRICGRPRLIASKCSGRGAEATAARSCPAFGSPRPLLGRVLDEAQRTQVTDVWPGGRRIEGPLYGRDRPRPPCGRAHSSESVGRGALGVSWHSRRMTVTTEELAAPSRSASCWRKRRGSGSELELRADRLELADRLGATSSLSEADTWRYPAHGAPLLRHTTGTPHLTGSLPA
jgi:hypothetical protein